MLGTRSIAIAGVTLLAIIKAGANASVLPSSSLSAQRRDDACHLAGAKTYVHAILTKSYADAEKIQTTEDVRRVEGQPGFFVPTAWDRKSLLLGIVAGPGALLGGPLYENRAPEYAIVNSTTVQANYVLYIGLANGTIPHVPTRIKNNFYFVSPESCLMNYIEVIDYIGETHY